MTRLNNSSSDKHLTNIKFLSKLVYPIIQHNAWEKYAKTRSTNLYSFNSRLCILNNFMKNLLNAKSIVKVNLTYWASRLKAHKAI